MTHTLAKLEVSRSCWDEIAGLLRDAGYGHAFLEDGMIDMQGIGLSARDPARSGMLYRGRPVEELSDSQFYRAIGDVPADVSAPSKPPAARDATITDPIERRIADALTEAGIEYEHESERHPPVAGLDFYLPRSNVHIECKQFFSPRIAEQMARAANVIVIQGNAAASFFAWLVAVKSR